MDKTKLDPLAELDRKRFVALAAAAQGAHSDLLGDLPPSLIALQVREFARFCEECDMDDSDGVDTLIKAAFAPTPRAMNQRDVEYLSHLIAGSETAAEARVKAAVTFLNTKGEK